MPDETMLFSKIQGDGYLVDEEGRYYKVHYVVNLYQRPPGEGQTDSVLPQTIVGTAKSQTAVQLPLDVPLKLFMQDGRVLDSCVLTFVNQQSQDYQLFNRPGARIITADKK